MKKYIKIVDHECDDPFVDRYGRVTYFYVKLANKQIMLY
jgi:hypothetical protein